MKAKGERQMRKMFALLVVLGFLMSAEATQAACQNNIVIMYTTRGCGWCARAREVFEANDVVWEERSARSIGYNYSPIFRINGVLIHGYNRHLLSRNLCIDIDEL
jgi:hypothetical protein